MLLYPIWIFVMALDKYVIYWGLTKSTAQYYTFFFSVLCFLN